MAVRAVLESILARRVVLLDGAMGTELLGASLGEAGVRGERFASHTHALKDNLDVLVLTRPAVIAGVHHAYLAAGCDLIQTNTFNSTPLMQADYGLAACAYELNVAAARLAKSACVEWTGRSPSQPRFAAGTIGPTNRAFSSSREAATSLHAVSSDELAGAYRTQALGLIDGGCDLLLVETVVDLHGANAALTGIARAQAERQSDLPVMVSATVSRSTGRLPSGETIGRFGEAIATAMPFSVGLNCSSGAREMRPHLEILARVLSCWISCHPSAGLPDRSGLHPEGPEQFAAALRECAAAGLVNIAGGCCGTTPAHLRAAAASLHGVAPRRRTPGR
jgi:5-methyltetrahydrofolate--homocysteine methyltransferase